MSDPDPDPIIRELQRICAEISALRTAFAAGTLSPLKIKEETDRLRNERDLIKRLMDTSDEDAHA